MSAVLIDWILYLYQHLSNQEQMTKTSKWKPDVLILLTPRKKII